MDPVELLDRLRGRVPLVHVKDFATRGERSFSPDRRRQRRLRARSPAAAAAGAEWLLVEQDEVEGSAVEVARRSFLALTQMLETP